jgi:diguanylate cyclase (GGDEF)-like protein/PAS domain S-box-containing protein
MKIPLFKNFSVRLPMVLLTLALVLTGMVFGWFIWRIEQSKSIATLRQEILTNPEKTGDSIVYLKEILMMSSRTSAATGDLRWEKEYTQYEARLATKIAEVKTVLPDSVELQSIDRLDTASLALLGMEKKAFMLIRDHHIEQARELLYSLEYEKQKAIFLAEIPNVVGQLNELQKGELASEYQYSNRFISIAIIVFGLSIIAWITAIRNISNSHRKLQISAAEKEQAQAALLKSEQYQNLFRLANDAILVIEPESEIVLDANEKACEIYKYKRDEFIGLSIKTINENGEHGQQQFTQLKTDGSAREFESVQLCADGTPLNVLINSSIIEYQGGEAILSINRDITARKLADAALRESESKMRTLLDSMSEGLIQVDQHDVIEFVNNRFCEITGYEREELLGKMTADVLFKDSEKLSASQPASKRLQGRLGQHELQLNKKNGETLYVIVGGAPVINAVNQIIGTMYVITDITERRRIEEQMVHDAFHDALTGLPNRKLFMEHLRLTLAREQRETKSLFAILFLDFDRFKMVNDSLGHTEGDRLLKAIAGRLSFILRPGDLVARIGGDEFTILLSEIQSSADALHIAERIHEEMRIPFDLGGSEIVTSASIGIAFSNKDYIEAEEILRDADIAMYRAKARGKACHQIFDQTMHEEARNRLIIEREMRQALEQNEFCLYYQPIVDLKNGFLSGFEALVRWKHPMRGMVSPAEFIPIAEESNLILPLGSWILNESCRQLRQWQMENPAANDLMISVNLSGKQFVQPDLVEQIAAALSETGLPPKCLKLEITESYLMENSELTVTTLNRLRALGLHLSLDDFGTGYSSLSYLHSLPVSYLKIDRSFVSRMRESRESSEMVETIIRLAQTLKMKVIAEGIETTEQMEHLQMLNCEFGQGYLFSKPVDPEAASFFIGRLANNFAPAALPTENLSLIG